MNKRKIEIIIGVAFIFATCFFIAGTVNHILNTGEGIISSILLALGSICAAVVFLRKSKENPSVSNNFMEEMIWER